MIAALASLADSQWSSEIYQGIANSQVALEPEMPHRGAFTDELSNAWHLGSSHALSVPIFVSVERPYLFGLDAVQKERRMSRYQQLGTFGRCATFLCEFAEKLRMQEILGFFDADEMGRDGVVEHDEVRQHLQRSIRGIARQDGLFE